MFVYERINRRLNKYVKELIFFDKTAVVPQKLKCFSECKENRGAKKSSITRARKYEEEKSN